MVRKFFTLCLLSCGPHCWSGTSVGFVPIETFARQHHLKMVQRTNTGEIYVKNEKHSLRFSPNSKEAFINNTKVFLTYPIGIESSTSKNKLSSIFSSKYLTISKVDVDKIILPILFPNKTLSKHLRTIVIDPGHGGKAEGAQNKRLKIKEKMLTLETAKALKKELERKGYIVYLTRSQDIDVSLDQRSKFANQKNADLFISIHYNAENSRRVQGIETFAYSFHGHPSTDGGRRNGRLASVNQFDGANTYLAWLVQKNLCKELCSNDRGVRRGRMAVLANLNCPGILIECGFLSDSKEASKLKTSDYQKKLVNASVRAVECFKDCMGGFFEKKPPNLPKKFPNVKKPLQNKQKLLKSPRKL